MQDESTLISVSVGEDREKQTADRTFDVMLSSDHVGTVFIPGETWSFTIPPNDLEVKLDPSMGPARFRKGAVALKFTVDGLQNSKTFAVSSTDARIAVRTGLIPADADRNSFDVVLGLTEGAELERRETIELEISHLDAFSRPGAQISSGGEHICGIKTDSTVACWGNQMHGQTTPTSNPRISEITNFLAVGAGGSHSCGILRDDDTVECWGNPDDGRTMPTSSPHDVGEREKFLAISAGGRHSCGVKTDSTMACWGSSADKQINFEASPQGVTKAAKFLAVGAGVDHTCGIKADSTVVCWGGAPTLVQVQNSAEVNPKSSPQGVTAATKFLAVSSGRDYSCGIRIDNTLACWGNPFNRQNYPTDNPRVNEDTQFLAVSAGRFLACGIVIDGTVECWGSSVNDQLNPESSPQGVTKATKFLAVGTGGSHTCGIKTDSTVACWGFPGNPPDGRITPTPEVFQEAAVIPDTFYLFEQQGMNVPAELQSAVRLRVKVFLEGALR